jgi:hypothetical protein
VQRPPTHFVAGPLVFRKHGSEHLAECRHIGRSGQEPRHIAREEAIETPDAGIRLIARPLGALAVVQSERFADRPVHDDERLPAWRAAAVLEAVLRVRHDLRDREENGHVFGTASGHHPVDRHVPDRCRRETGMHDAEHLIRRPVGELQECLDLLQGRRHDREPVAPKVPQEVFVHFLECSGEHDVAGAGLPCRQRRFVRASFRGQLLDDLIDEDVLDVLRDRRALVG